MKFSNPLNVLRRDIAHIMAISQTARTATALILVAQRAMTEDRLIAAPCRQDDPLRERFSPQGL
jgi:hypothetical protein